ncbi:acetylglutamate kinase [candidate division KSB1 bacterium]|nr:acetylglutamate kinase [candidate division KSB1 bacterium]RQW00409.1 MAG: acetylglutamate kinase [candidate division KSB1 bacterium]
MKKRILLKIGGAAFSDKAAFAELAGAIKSLDAEVLILHGGGVEISEALKAAKRETVFINGVRITQKEDVDIVESILSETINGRIASYLTENGVECERMSGKSDALLVAEKTARDGKDIGFVGEIVQVNPWIVLDVLSKNRVPIISPISASPEGVTYNVNADTAAAALAIGAFCTDLVYFSDVPGVLDENKNVLPTLTVDAGRFLIQTGIISGGMVAKLESIFRVIDQGVERVHVMQWQGRDTLRHLIDGRDIIKTTIKR